MLTCAYIMIVSGLISVIGLAIGLRKSPYRRSRQLAGLDMPSKVE